MTIFFVSYLKTNQTRDLLEGNKTKKQQAIECALQLYKEEKNKGVDISSQCLGVWGDYAVDIVHVPRSSEDNLIENQCQDYRNGKVHHFIELDKNGNIVRIV